MEQYLRAVVNHGILEQELYRVQCRMLQLTQFPEHDQDSKIRLANTMFKSLLAQKAYQERVEHMRQHNRRSTQDSGTRPADDAPRCISIRHILQQKIAGSG